MSENEPPEVPATALGPVRPLSIRITDGLRAQLDVIAQLNDRSVTEEIRLALEAWVQTSKSDPNGAPARRDGAGRNRTRSPDAAERHRGHHRRRRFRSEDSVESQGSLPVAGGSGEGGCPGIECFRALCPGGCPKHHLRQSPTSLLPRGLSEN